MKGIIATPTRPKIPQAKTDINAYIQTKVRKGINIQYLNFISLFYRIKYHLFQL